MSLQLGLERGLDFPQDRQVPPGDGQRDTSVLWWCSCTSQGQSRLRSFLLSSVVPGLVAQAVFCLGLIKSNKNQIQAARPMRRKTNRPAFHHVTAMMWGKMPIDLPLTLRALPTTTLCSEERGRQRPKSCHLRTCPAVHETDGPSIPSCHHAMQLGQRMLPSGQAAGTAICEVCGGRRGEKGGGAA